MTELSPATSARYVRLALERLVGVAERLGDERGNQRPHGVDTNSVAALIVHCCGVCEFWLGHLGLGRESNRDRDAEFSATASVAELRAMVDASVRQVEHDLVALESAPPSRYAAGREFLAEADRSDASLVLRASLRSGLRRHS